MQRGISKEDIPNKRKILVKVKMSGSLTGQAWVHLCHVPFSVYARYFKDRRRSFGELQSRMISWAKEDFNIKVRLDTKANVEKFKRFIDEMYRRNYTDILPKDGFNFSKGGWCALWITKHMEMELEEEREDFIDDIRAIAPKDTGR